ncbi:uncharacterized protein [Miscanthus floridulus]|uniref:uncharacterized protein n=1 Tax=Miscanthus floridulus TaxID=154761 RepID=UPI003459B3C9
MSWKGSTQINVVDQRTLSDKQQHHSQSQWSDYADDEHWSTENTQELVNLGTTKRAGWSHQMKLFLIDLLKEHDVPGFRTHNAWSKDAWTNIVRRVNAKFGTSYSVNQVKHQEQDLKKAYRSVKDLLAESGFGWDTERMMVTAPASVWSSFTARNNNKDAFHWQDRSFPYYDALSSLYDGRHAEGRTHQGMDHYASKAKNVLVPSTQTTQVADTYDSPSPTLNAPGESDLQFHLDEETEEQTLIFRSLHLIMSISHAPTSTHMHREASDSRRGNKKQKSKVALSDDGFHERYLKLKKEEIDRFAAIEEKKLEDPYSINKKG